LHIYTNPVNGYKDEHKLSTLFIVLLVGIMVSSAFWQLLNFCSKVLIASRSNGKALFVVQMRNLFFMKYEVLKAWTVSSQWRN